MYKLYKNPDGEIKSIVRLLDNAIIPFDIRNTDYQEYCRWLEEDNTPEPADNE